MLFLKINEQYLHLMTLYTSKCDIMAMRLLLYGLNPIVIEIYFYVWHLIQRLFCDMHTMYGWGHSYDFASSVGYSRSDSVELIVI
jgi:hypothetical protein